MEKILYFVRHAKSDWSIPGEKDFDRELNSRGYADAPRMGRKLFDLGVRPDLIVSSPARRAKLTCEFIAEQLKYDTEQIIYNDEIYESSVRSLLSVIHEFDDKYGQIVVFGHNPTLTYLAESLTKKEIGNIPTCGVVAIKFNLETWKDVAEETGELKWFIFPNKDL